MIELDQNKERDPNEVSRMKTSPDIRKKLLWITAPFVAYGIVTNMRSACDKAIWWKEYYSPDSNVVLMTMRNFLSEWTFFDTGKFLSSAALFLQLTLLVHFIVHKLSQKFAKSPESAAKGEKRTGIVLFVLSFLPIAFVLGASVVSMFTGVSEGLFGGDTIYGWSAFMNTFGLMCLVLCAIPILPAMLIFQIVFVVGRVRAKRIGGAVS